LRQPNGSGKVPRFWEYGKQREKHRHGVSDDRGNADCRRARRGDFRRGLQRSIVEPAIAGNTPRAAQNLVIFFRDQDITPEQHLAVGRIFGEPYATPFVKSRDGYPEILDIVREPEDHSPRFFAASWHTDMSFEKTPAMGSVLYALETPPYGGDTMWSSMEAAYAALSPGMRAMLDGMTAIHSARNIYGKQGRYAQAENRGISMKIDTSEEGERMVEHPVVRSHPETGRKALFVNPNYTIGFKDMSEAESAPLLAFLCEHAVRPEFTCRFRWTPGAIAVWDNRNTMHRAIGDYQGFRRHINRVTIRGDRPH